MPESIQLCGTHRVIPCLVLLALLLALAIPVQAQQQDSPESSKQPRSPATQGPKEPAGIERYLEIPSSSKEQLQRETAQRSQWVAVRRMLVSGTIEAAKRDVFDTYYKTYALARWTWTSKQTELVRYRRELLIQLATTAPGPTRTRLLEIVVPCLTAIAEGNFHPVARYNAILTIGLLNKQEPTGSDTPAVPLPEALPILLRTIKNPASPDAIKVAGLLGVLRHATLGFPTPDSRSEVLSVVLKIAGDMTPLSSSSEGHCWMRQRAVAIIGLIGLLDSSNSVPLALAQIVSEREASFALRCAAARTLGMLDYSTATDLDVADLAIPLTQLAVDICQKELDSINASASTTPPKRSSSYGDYSPYEDMMSPMPTATVSAPPTPQLDRMALLPRLYAVTLGLTGAPTQAGPDVNAPIEGIASLLDGATCEPTVRSVMQRVNALILLCREKDVMPETFRTAVIEKLDELQEDLTTLSSQTKAEEGESKAQPAQADA